MTVASLTNYQGAICHWFLDGEFNSQEIKLVALEKE